jgi:hypothetical protein
MSRQIPKASWSDLCAVLMPLAARSIRVWKIFSTFRLQPAGIILASLGREWSEPW